MGSWLGNALRDRWLGLCVGMWMQACGGISYVFSLYSGNLKEVLGYNQEMIDGIGTFKDIGGNVGIISGLLIDVTSAWFVLLIGGVLHFSFFTLLYLAATGHIEPSYWQMCVIMTLGTNGSTWFNTAVLVTCMRNFASDRGVTVGLLKGFIGLSGAIFSQVYTAIYAPHTGPFLLLCATVPPLIALMSMFVIQPVEAPKHRSDTDKSNFLTLYVIGITLAFYLLAVILVQDIFVVSKSLSCFFMAVMLIILLLPGLIPWKTRGDIASKGYSQLSTEAPFTPGIIEHNYSKHQVDQKKSVGLQHNFGWSMTIDAAPKAQEAPKEMAKPLPETPSKRKSRLGQDHTLLEAASTRDYWLLFFAMGCGTGSGLTAINNLAQMAESAGSQSTGTFVALVSVWNFLGRMAAGYVSEWYMKKYGTPRPLFLLAVQAVMGVAHLFFSTAVPAMLYLASVLVGLAHGAHWTLMVATSSELFGLKHFGSVYNTLSISAPLGSYFLSVKLAGYIYDRQALAAQTLALAQGAATIGPHKCMGPQCFRPTFLVMTCVCGLGSLALLYLTSRTSKLYRDIFKRQVAKNQTRMVSSSCEDAKTASSAPNQAEEGQSPTGFLSKSTGTDVHRLRHSSPAHRHENLEASVSSYQ